MAGQGRLRVLKVVRWWAVILLCCSGLATALTLSPQVQHGVSWLAAKVQPGGAVNREDASRATTTQNRDESLRTLQLLSAGSASPDMAGQDTTATEYLARQVLSLGAKGQNATTALVALASRQNSDGGFGLNAGSASTALDSAWALAALAQQPPSYGANIAALKTWLYADIKADGGLDGFSAKDRTQASSVMLLALASLTPDLPARNTMQQLAAWLAASQAADGSWGEDLYLTAYALSALTPVSADATLQQNAASYLLARQSANGSWNDDPFLTAVILRALAQSPATATASNSIVGHVFAADGGQALSGVVVTADNSTTTTGTDVRGGFSLTGLAAGNQTLHLTLAGYQTQTLSINVPGSGGLDLGSLLLLQNGSTSTVTGTVTSGSTHQPIAGATVSVSGNPPQTATTDASGHYQISNIAGGSITVTVSATGYASVSGTATASGGVITFQPVLYPQGTTPPGGNATLSGKVLEQGSNQPLANVQVLVNQQAVVVTDAGGNYSLNLAGGSYTLGYQRSGYSTTTAQLAVNSGDVATLQTVYLTTQATTSTVNGIVTDSVSHAALSGATVQIVGGASTTADASGHYSLSGINGTQFTVRASATGYNSQNLQLQVSQPMTLTENFALVAQAGQGIVIDAITSTPGSASLNTSVVFATTYRNTGGSSANIVPQMQIADATGHFVSSAHPYATAAGNDAPLGAIALAPSASQNVYFRWSTGQFAPGQYTVLASALLVDSITYANLAGIVVAQQQGSVTITGQARLTGGLTATPPVQKVTAGGSLQSVQISGTIQNVGNISVNTSAAQVQVADQSGHVVVTLPATLPALDVQQTAQVNLATWTNPVAGSFKVKLLGGTGEDIGINTTAIYVGQAAVGAFTATPTVVGTGTQTVHGQVSMSGINAVSAAMSNPTAILVKAAITNAVAYDDPETIDWLNTHGGCIGCHVIPQAVFGGETSYKYTTGDPTARRTMLTTIERNQHPDGSIWRWGAPIEETLLFQWGLTAWHVPADVMPTLIPSANFIAGQQGQGGLANGWRWDHCDPSQEGWFYLSDYSANAIAAYNLNHTIQLLQNNPNIPVQAAAAQPWGLPSYGGSGGRMPYQTMIVEDEAGTPYIEMQDGNNTWHIARIALDGSGNYTYMGSLPGFAAYFHVNNGIIYANINGTIRTFDYAGNALPQQYGNFGTYGSFAVDSTGKIYAAVGNGSNLNVLNGGTTTPMGLTGVRYVATDKADNLYVVMQNTVYQAYANGTTVKIYDFANTINSLGTNNEGGLIVGLNVGNTLTIISPRGGMLAGYNAEFGYGVQLADGSYLLAKGASETNSDNLQHLIQIRFQPYTSTQIANFVATYGQSMQKMWTYWQSHMPPPISTTQGYTGGCVPEASNHASSGDYGFTLIALGNIAQYFDLSNQPALAAQVRQRMPALVTALRQSQRSDGSWDESFWKAGVSDPLTTAIVGYSLQYAGLSPQDPMLLNAISYELNHQAADGSWPSGYMQTRAAATNWVAIFLPVALDQLAGIDTDLHLAFPASTILANPSIAPTDVSTAGDGSKLYRWSFAKLTDTQQNLGFDLTLSNLVTGEVRPAASDAYLSFLNSYTNETVNEPLAVPSITASAGLALTLGTDNTSYGANNPVTINGVVSNAGAGVSSGTVHFAVHAADGTLVADLGSQPFAGLAPSAQSVLNGAWNTGTLLPNAYYVEAVLADATGAQVSNVRSNFTITSSSAVGSLLGASVSTDKAVYGPQDTVALQDHVTNLTSNTLVGSLVLATTVTAPGGATVWSRSDNVGELVPGASRDFTANLPVASAADGVYTVSLRLIDSNGAVQAAASNSYRVQSTTNTGQGLAATLALSAPSLSGRAVLKSDSLTLNAVITNQGNAAVSSLPVMISVLDPSSHQVLASWQDILSALAVGGNSTLSHAWPVGGVYGQGYVAVVTTGLTGDTALAQQVFTVAKPALTLAINAAKATYDVNEQLQANSTVNSLASIPLAGLQLQRQVLRPNGSTLWQDLLTGQGLAAHGSLSHADMVALGRNAPGNYQLVLKVLDADGVQLAQAGGSFVLRSTADTGTGLNGSLTNPAAPVAGAQIPLGFTLSDQGNGALSNLPVQVIVRNATTGTVLATLPTTVAALPLDGQANGQLNWDSHGVLSGTVITVSLQVQVGSGWISLAQQAFTLEKPLVTSTINGVVATGYAYNGPVSVTATVQNQSVVGFTPATVSWSLTAPDGSVLEHHDVSPAPNLPANTSIDLPYSYTFSHAVPGAYTLKISTNGNGESLNEKTATLTVQSTADTGAGLSGAMTLPPSIQAGSSAFISYTVSDAGNADLANLPAQLVITNTSTGAIVATLPTTITALAQGGSVNGSLNWNSLGITSGTPLQSSLQVQVTSGWITLTHQDFTLVKPPVATSLSGVVAAGYAYNGTVSVNAAINNQSTVNFTPGTVIFTLTSPTGTVLDTHVTTPAPTLPAGAVTPVPYSYAFTNAAPGTYVLSATVSGNGESLSAGTTSIVVQSTADTGAGLAGTLSGLTGIVAGSMAPISLTVSDNGNASLANLPAQVVISNTSNNGNVVVATLPTTIATLTQGGSATGSVSWNSLGITSGTPLTATLQVQVTSGWITLTQQPFTLSKPPVATSLSGVVAGGYAYNGTVSVNAAIQNQSSVSFTPATVTWTLTSPTGTVVNTATVTPAPNLPANATTPVPFSYTFSNAAPGNYTLSVSVSGNGESLSTASTTVMVQSSAQTGSGLTGVLGNSPTAPTLGQTVVISEAIANAGNAAFTNLPVTLTVRQGSTVVQTYSDTIASLAIGGNQNLVHNWLPAANGSYTETITTVVNGTTLTLASQAISVTAPPVQISVSPVAGAHARLLVYYSCQPGWQNGLIGWLLGMHNYACFDQRKTTLTTYLNSLGVPYTLVKDDDAFTKAMRTGQYNNYWLLGAVEPVEDDLTDELREAVNRGDSLVIDGGTQSWTNYPLYHIAGVQYEGHINFTNNSGTLSFNAPLYADLTSVSNLSAYSNTGVGQPPLYFKVLSGTVAANWQANQCPSFTGDFEPGQLLDLLFLGQHPSTYPAIVSGTYGQGKTLAIAFDLVASLQGGTNTPVSQASQLNTSWSTVLVDSISYSTPATVTRALVPGEMFAARFPIQNQGQAANIYANLTQPAGGSYLSANLPGTLQGNGSEQFSVTLAQSQTFNLLTDQVAPATPGTYNLTLSAQTNATPPTALGSFTYSFTVGASQSSRISTVNSEINAIPTTLSNLLTLTTVKNYFSTGVTALNWGNVGGAIDAWADAGENLANVSGTQAAQARIDLDLLLKQTEAQWAATH